MAIIVRIDVMMARRKMSLNELSERVEITPANLSILKNGKARAIRFSTLEAICRVLECQPGDIIEYHPDDTPTSADAPVTPHDTAPESARDTAGPAGSTDGDLAASTGDTPGKGQHR